MIGYIYKTTNLVNGKIYVGKRKLHYFDENYKGSGVILHEAINKYGWDNFKVELIEECETEEQMNEREKFWIAELHSLVSDSNYNIQDGGNGGWGSGKNHNWYGKHHSEETKRKMSDSVKKSYERNPELRRTRAKVGYANKGRHMSDKVKQKISNSLKGRHASEAQKIAARNAMKKRWSEYRQRKEQ